MPSPTAGHTTPHAPHASFLVRDAFTKGTVLSPITDAMMLHIKDASCDGRLRVSSSGSVYKPPDVIFINRKKIHITTASRGFNCILSAEDGVLLIVEGNGVQSPVVHANPVESMGVWIQIKCNSFWLEIYAAEPNARQRQLISQQAGS